MTTAHFTANHAGLLAPLDDTTGTIQKYFEWLYPTGTDTTKIVVACIPPLGTVFPESHKRAGYPMTYWGHIVDNPAAAALSAEHLSQRGARAVWSSIHRGGGHAGRNKWEIEDCSDFRFLALDFDNVLPPFTPRACATDAEVQRIGEHVSMVKSDLIRRGLPEPLHVMTGNGHLLLFPITLATVDDPFDASAPKGIDNIALMKELANCLAIAYDTDFCELDTGVVGDPSRILGVPGTINQTKPEIPEQGRIARNRAIIGAYPERDPMPQAEFIAWAKSYITEAESLNATKLAERRKYQPAQTGQRIEHDGAPASPKTIRRVKSYLEKIPVAVEGEGGDSHTFKTAGHMLSFGLSQGEVLEVMRDWNSQCSPPWSEDDLRGKITSAAKNGTPRADKREGIASTSLTGIRRRSTFTAVCEPSGYDEHKMALEISHSGGGVDKSFRRARAREIFNYV